MSKITTKMTSMWRKLKNRNYRDAFTSAKVDSDLSAQIYALREQRGWTQADLAREADMKQPRIATLEASCDGVSTTTLKRIASAFDVALEIRFIPYSQMVTDSVNGRIDKPVPSFDFDVSPVAIPVSASLGTAPFRMANFANIFVSTNTSASANSEVVRRVPAHA